MPALATKDLVKHFDGVHAVDHLSLAFEVGKVTSLIGPNGSGKSTFINLLTGLYAFDHGTVVIGTETTLAAIAAHEIATYGLTRTFQDVRLFEQLPVLDNILVVLTERGIWASLFERHSQFHLEKAEMVLKQVGLWEKRHELASSLSYGQRKLLEIARALAMIHAPSGEATTFFFDEPFAGLFPEMVKIVVGIIKDLREMRKTVILVEHNMDLIRQLSDYVIVLDSGKLLAEGEPEAVLRDPRVIEAYLGE